MVRELVPVDYVEASLTTSDDTYLYGADVNDSSAISQWNPVTKATVQIYDFGGTNTVDKVFSYSDDGVYFATVNRSGSGNIDLYRATNPAGPWTRVWTIGTIDANLPIHEASQISNVKLLSVLSMCRATVSGATVYFAAEYNTNGSRTNGGANDEIKIVKSTDLGATWATVTKWNTDGANNNLRHFHCVQQDPVNGRILASSGDTVAGVLEFDPTGTAPPNNTNIDSINTATAVGSLDQQKFRATGFVFARDSSGNYTDGILWQSDNTGTAAPGEGGIWRVERKSALGIQSPTFVGKPYNDEQFGMQMLGTATGEIFAFDVSAASQAVKESCLGVSVSTNGRDFTRVARMNVTNGAVPFPQGFVWHDSKLYLATNSAVLRNQNGSTVCEFGGEYTKDKEGMEEYYPDFIHPVVWVAPGGSNVPPDDPAQKGGWTPRTPLATPDYAMFGERSPANPVMVPGARVMVAAGTYGVEDAETRFSGALPGDAGLPVQFTGGGASTTLWCFTTATSTNYAITGLTGTYLLLEKLTLKKTVNDNNTELVRPNGANFKFVARDCILGHAGDTKTFGIGQWSQNGCMLQMIRSYSVFNGIENLRFNGANTGTLVKTASSAFLGAPTRQVTFRNSCTSAFDFESTMFDGYTTSAIEFESTALPAYKSIKRCDFEGPGAPVVDATSITWTLGEVDNNAVDATVVGVFDLNGNSNLVAETTLVTTDDTVPSVAIPKASPLNAAGNYSDTFYDLNGVKSLSLRDIGPLVLSETGRPAAGTRTFANR